MVSSSSVYITRLAMAMEQCRYRFRNGAVESSKFLISDLKLCWRTAIKCSGCNMFIPFWKSENFDPGNLQHQICSCIGTPLLGAQGLPTKFSLRHHTCTRIPITHQRQRSRHKIAVSFTKHRNTAATLSRPMPFVQPFIGARSKRDSNKIWAP